MPKGQVIKLKERLSAQVGTSIIENFSSCKN